MQLKLNSLISKFKPAFNGRYIWKGVYKNFSDVPKYGNGFEGDSWVNSVRRLFRDPLPDVTLDKDSYPLALVASIIKNKDKAVKIIDFGGSAGITYLALKNILPAGSIEYCVLEKQRICEIGAEFFHQDKQIYFSDVLPNNKRFDIVYLCSSLQYIENYRGFIKNLAEYKPEYFVFSRISAGRIPTYATAQINIKETSIPYWFINIEEITEILKATGYSLIFNAKTDWRYDQGNFPSQLRLKNARNLIFTKTTKDKI